MTARLEDLHDEEVPNLSVPRGALVGAAALVVLSLALAATARLTGFGRSDSDVAIPVGAVTRDVRFALGTADSLFVSDAADGTTIAAFAAGEGGFVRGSLRAFSFERRRASAPDSGAFRLARWPNGRVTLDDLTTGYHVELNAFGADNAAAFAALLR